MPRNHDTDKPILSAPRGGFKEAEARASESRREAPDAGTHNRAASKRPRHVPRNHENPRFYLSRFTSLQRGRGTCLGITSGQAPHTSPNGLASKRPRHVPRNHKTSIHYMLTRDTVASKRPRHVPRNHAVFLRGPAQGSWWLQRGRGTCLGITVFRGFQDRWP